MLKGSLRLVAAGIVAASVGWGASAHAASIAVTASDFQGIRTNAAGGGVTTPNGWAGNNSDNGFQIAWDIEAVGNGNNNAAGGLNPFSQDAFFYTYWISGISTDLTSFANATSSLTDLSKGLSHWNLEISKQDPTGNELASYHFDPGDPQPSSDSPKEHGGSGNPDTTFDIFGFKFDGGGSKQFHVEFWSTNEPVWGSFYAKDGNLPMMGPAITAHNTGSSGGVTMPAEGETDFSGWIARPDGTGDPPTNPPVVPLPAAAWMGMMMLGGLGAIKKVRNKKLS